MTDDLITLSRQWAEAKKDEKEANAKRLEIEAMILQEVDLPEGWAKTETIKVDNLKLKITGRMQYKIDNDQLQQLAIKNNIFDQLKTLFRWSPTLNKRAWDDASGRVRTILSRAITITPAKPTILVTTIGDNDHAIS